MDYRCCLDDLHARKNPLHNSQAVPFVILVCAIITPSLQLGKQKVKGGTQGYTTNVRVRVRKV